uniref:N-acetyltransferase domain-containing protein n=1 Tax=Caenorhabditis japonica TaxID=281687 RepID=A0A8R1DQC3_CAEJA
MGVTAELNMQKGVKVVLNPSQEYFNQFQEWISETERWNYRHAEYKLWLATFEKFWMYMAIDEEHDEVISAVSLALQRHPDGTELYSIGNYYCVPEWRGKGISNKLFKQVMKDVGKHNCQLFGAVEMSPLYAQRFNFAIMPDFWHIFADIDVVDLVIPPMPNGLTCKKIEENDWEKLHEYDEKICDLNRRKYMRMNLSLTGTVSRLVLNESGKIVGFGAIKMATGNELIMAPLYAESLDAATALISSILNGLPTLQSYSTLISIYPDANNDVPRLLSLLTNGNFETHKAYRHQFTQRMMRFPQEKIFATDEVSHSPC